MHGGQREAVKWMWRKCREKLQGEYLMNLISIQETWSNAGAISKAVYQTVHDINMESITGGVHTPRRADVEL